MDGAGEVLGIVEQRDLDQFSAPAGGMRFNVGETRRTEGDVLKDQILISGNGRTSLHPPLHTHTHTHTHTLSTPPQLSYSRVEKESGIDSNIQIMITH